MISSGRQVLVGGSGDRAGVAVGHHGIDQPVRAAVGDVLAGRSRTSAGSGCSCATRDRAPRTHAPGRAGLRVDSSAHASSGARSPPARGDRVRCACARRRRSTCVRPSERSALRSSIFGPSAARQRRSRGSGVAAASRPSRNRAIAEAASRTGSSPRDDRFRSRAAPGRGTRAESSAYSARDALRLVLPDVEDPRRHDDPLGRLEQRSQRRQLRRAAEPERTEAERLDQRAASPAFSSPIADMTSRHRSSRAACRELRTTRGPVRRYGGDAWRRYCQSSPRRCRMA